MLPAVVAANGWTWRIPSWKGRLGKSSAEFWNLGYTGKCFSAITEKKWCAEEAWREKHVSKWEEYSHVVGEKNYKPIKCVF